MSYAAFAEARIGGEPSGGNDDRRQALFKKVEAMVKAGAEYRR